MSFVINQSGHSSIVVRKSTFGNVVVIEQDGDMVVVDAARIQSVIVAIQAIANTLEEENEE